MCVTSLTIFGGQRQSKATNMCGALRRGCKINDYPTICDCTLNPTRPFAMWEPLYS